MNEEYDFDKFTEDSSDDYPKYDGGVEFYPYAASKKEDVLKENIAIAKADSDRKASDYSTFDKKLEEKDLPPRGSTPSPKYNDVTLPEGYEDMDFELSKEKKELLAEEVNRQFNTGAQRDTGCNKLRHSLIPHEALERVTRRYLDGAEKYGENNWTKGMPLSVYYDSAMRHMHAWWNGDENEDHAAAAVWNMLCAMWTEDNAAQHLAKEGEFLDDRHKYPRD